MSILNGLKILDFSSMLPGPFATMLFADYGAEVLHVESSKRVDMMRIMPPYDENKQSYVHQHLNRNKHSISLNLKTDEAKQIIHQLVKEYDIIVEGFRPGVMKRLGLDYEALKEVHPSIIYCSITGYGQTGPYAERPGHDLNYLSVGGVLHHSRHQHKKPVAMGIQISDFAGGAMHAAIAILASVVQRQQKGIGQYIDISMTDAVFSMNALASAQYFGSARIPQPEEEILNGGTFYDFYETKDGRYFSVGSIEPPFRKLLCEALGIPELIDSTFNDSSYTQRRFKEAICDSFKTKTFKEWLLIFDDQFHGCVEPVLDFEEACNHPQIQARHLIVDVPTKNGETQKQIGSAIKFAGIEPSYTNIGQPLGAQTNEILSKLGYSAEQIQHFTAQGILE